VKNQRMSFHFASHEYDSCFRDLPQPNVTQLRQATLSYLDTFDPNTWYQDPIDSLCKGEKLGGNIAETVDALGQVNGKQLLASEAHVKALKEHISTYKSPYTDLRDKMRAIEASLLTEHAGFLIGNQCLDFGKQDGITEIEESGMANVVEQRLNDLLLRDEASGMISVNRQPIYVSCVSNFSNFLDMFRKTIRSIECGIPCLVLSRSNTSQYCYRWTQLLLGLMQKAEIDPGMLTFLSCSLEDIKDITKSCSSSTGNLYMTGSRALAKDIMAGYPNTIASTGGPNTLVALDALTPAMSKAIQTSASIESAGQCTALRHVVVPGNTTEQECRDSLNTTVSIPNSSFAVHESMFDGVLPGKELEQADFTRHETAPAYYTVRDVLPATIDEHWRKVVVDFTCLDDLSTLPKWLNDHQPISLAVNGERQTAMRVGLQLFEQTGMVINSKFLVAC
jgi:hypothetical protein